MERFNEMLLQDLCSSSYLGMYVNIGALIIIGIIIGFMIGVSSDFNDFYRRGQIDALNGKVKYEKKENEDGEILWTEKPSIKTTGVPTIENPPSTPPKRKIPNVNTDETQKL